MKPHGKFGYYAVVDARKEKETKVLHDVGQLPHPHINMRLQAEQAQVGMEEEEDPTVCTVRLCKALDVCQGTGLVGKTRCSGGALIVPIFLLVPTAVVFLFLVFGTNCSVDDISSWVIRSMGDSALLPLQLAIFLHVPLFSSP